MGASFAGDSKKLSEAERLQNYSTMNTTKIIFVERTIRSLKIIFNRYMQYYG